MENLENNFNEVVEEKKEEVIETIEALKVDVSEERKTEINKEIDILKKQLENNKKDLLKFFEEQEKIQKKIQIRENNVNYLENKIRALILEREGLEVRF
jgi:hypothetical protein